MYATYVHRYSNKSRHLVCGWAKLDNCKIVKLLMDSHIVPLILIYVAKHTIERERERESFSSAIVKL
jgi:hypothetical protein